MPNHEIDELRAAVAELKNEMSETQQGLRSAIDGTHATLHLLAFVFANRCMAAPDPMRAYVETAKVLLSSIGGDAGTKSSGDPAFDAALRGVRHHVSQFLLTLKAHVEANVATNRSGRAN